MRKYWLGMFFLLWGTTVAAALPGQSEMDSILASVNGEAISLVDVLPLTAQREIQLGVTFSGAALEREVRELRKKAVDRLIDHKLLQSEYAKQSFRISNRDIEREMDRVAENMGCRSRDEWIRRLRRDGVTLEQMRQEVEKNMMVQLMIHRQIRIDGSPSPRETYEFFKKHESEYAQAEKIGLAMLRLEGNRPTLDADMREISAALGSGKADFSALVKKFAPQSGDGYLGEIERNLLRPEFSAAIKTARPGKVVGPLRVDDGVVWLKVVSHQAAVKADFAAVEQRIRQDMEKARHREVLDEYFRKLRSQAVIEYFF